MSNTILNLKLSAGSFKSCQNVSGKADAISFISVVNARFAQASPRATRTDNLCRVVLISQARGASAYNGASHNVAPLNIPASFSNGVDATHRGIERTVCRSEPGSVRRRCIRARGSALPGVVRYVEIATLPLRVGHLANEHLRTPVQRQHERPGENRKVSAIFPSKPPILPVRLR